MEKSYYTVVARDEKGVVAYNTKTCALVELTEEEACDLDQLPLCDNEERARLFLEAGIAVNSAEAEADEVLYREHRCRHNSRMFELTITPSRVCNFACDYCYVPKRPETMSEAVQDALIAFVQDHYDRRPFKELRVNWYGGEPLLHIDAMERISAPLIALCRRHGVDYIGHVLSNASLADARMSRRLKENCGIVSVMPTVSGFGDMQDWQRPARDGTKYFDTIMDNIDAMIDAGIIVHMNYVTNKNNIEECTELAHLLAHTKRVRTRLSKTGAFGKEAIYLADGCRTPIELFSLEEFGPHYVDFFRRLDGGSREYRLLLKPVPAFCAALVSTGLFIDETGDVFCCMVDMDYPERALFNVADWAVGDTSVRFDRFLEFERLEPARDPECRRCRILPICHGGCYEKYLASGEHACHNIKVCIEDIVLDYRDALRREQGQEQACGRGETMANTGLSQG